MQEYLLQTPVASIILVFTLVTSIYTFSNPDLFGKLMLHPYSVSKGKNIHTVLTSGLIHRDWMHLAFNMLTFFFFAFPLEKLLAQLSSWGHIQFLLIYVIALILSDITTIIKEKNNYRYHSLGASGAISAVLFSYILFNPTMSLYLFFIPIPIPAVIFGPLFLVYCVWAANAARDSINHDAHFYGALSGLSITILMYPQIIGHFLNEVLGMLG
jgi:membrane associated rhomboid family serine protease